jgi:type II secretory pathway component PulF
MSRPPGEEPRRRHRPEPPRDPYGLDETEQEPESTEPDLSRPQPVKRGKRVRGTGDREPPPVTGGPTWLERFFLGSVSSKHLAQFCRQFAQYTDAGVPLLKSLSSLERQFAATALGPVLTRMGQSIRQGDSMHEAMAREPRAFDKLFLGTIRVAEARGGVPEALRRLADHFEKRVSLLRQARSAMIYPVIVLTIAGGVIALLTMFVLPGLISALDMKQGDLPLPTRLLIGFSKFMSANGWWAIPVGVVGAVFGLRQAYRTPAGKAAMDEIVLHVPVFGPLLRKIDTSRFARTLGLLLDAGVDLPSSLDLAADVMKLAPYRRVMIHMKEAIHDGSDLLDAMTAARRFPIDVLSRVEAGEESGKLPESLDKLADDYDEQIALTVKNLGTLVQPLIMLILGGIVFFVAVAFIMAYVSALQSASHL